MAATTRSQRLYELSKNLLKIFEKHSSRYHFLIHRMVYPLSLEKYMQIIWQQRGLEAPNLEDTQHVNVGLVGGHAQDRLKTCYIWAQLPVSLHKDWHGNGGKHNMLCNTSFDVERR